MFATGASRWPPRRRCRRCRRAPCAPRRGRRSCGRSTTAGWCAASSSPAAATTRRAAWRSRRRCPPATPVLAARFDNLKEGAPAMVGADVVDHATTPGRRRARAATAPPRAPRRPPPESPRHVDHPRLHQQSGLRDDGDGRDRRARALFVLAAARSSRCRTSACRSCSCSDRVPGRLARGGRGRRHQAARVRAQHRRRRQADPLEFARGLEPGVRRVPAQHRHEPGDAGRPRQGRARPARVPARGPGSAHRARRHRRTSSRSSSSR